MDGSKDIPYTLGYIFGFIALMSLLLTVAYFVNKKLVFATDEINDIGKKE